MKKQVILSFCMLLVISGLLAVQSHRAAKSQQKLTEIYRGAVLSAIQQMDDMLQIWQKASPAQIKMISAALKGVLETMDK